MSTDEPIKEPTGQTDMTSTPRQDVKQEPASQPEKPELSKRSRLKLLGVLLREIRKRIGIGKGILSWSRNEENGTIFIFYRVSNTEVKKAIIDDYNLLFSDLPALAEEIRKDFQSD